ncbi:MAG TPA: hypothetical protein VEG32_05535 [Clostridia bacterium]|nr:hypothetical protein [Clostridia bacterium]
MSKTATKVPPTRTIDARENGLDFAAAKACMREAGLLGDGQMETIVAKHMAKHRVNVLKLERGEK